MRGRGGPFTLVEQARRARRQGLRAKLTGLPLSTVQRFMNAEGSPTLATVETVAAALGLALKVEAKA